MSAPDFTRPANARVPAGMTQTPPPPPPPPPRRPTVSHSVFLCAGQGQHHTANPAAATPKPYDKTSLAKIKTMMDNPPSVAKEVAQWVIFTDYTGAHARNASHLRASDANYFALWGDIDEAAGVTFKEILQRTVAAVNGAQVYAYTSRSATAGNQKARIILPLAEPVDACTFELMQQVLNDRIAAAGLQPDRVTETCNQLCYLPNRGEFWEAGEGGCEPLTPKVLANEVTAIMAKRQAEAEARQVRMVASAARYAELVASQGVTPIQAANEAYGDPFDLWVHYGATIHGQRLCSPHSQSGAAAITCTDGKWISRHGSDVAAGIGMASDCGRYCYGDSFDLIKFFEYGNDHAAAIKAVANQFDPAANKERQRQYASDRDAAEALAAFNSVKPNQVGSTEEHALSKFVDLSAPPLPPDWVIPNFIAEGLVIIAGGHGVGKTTTLLPLAMAAAGIHSEGYALAPKHWRHVVYITEDVPQAQRIMTGYGQHLAYACNKMGDRVHVVEAQRMSADNVVKVGGYYRDQFSRTVTTVGANGAEYTTELLPLVVIDTMSATIELESENDNSEASQAVAALKQRFADLPVWIVGHVAKANLGRSDAVTLRGAGAFEADANQVLYLVQEEMDKSRWLVRGKTRFESPWDELEIHSSERTVTVKNRYGEDEQLPLRWSVANPSLGNRTERAEKAKTERDQLEAEELKRVILTNVEQRYAAGSPLNKTALRDITGRSAAITSNAIATLIADAWLHEIEVPAKERLKNKHSFLVALDAQERAEFLELGVIPEAKQWIPESWKKQADTI